MADSTRPGERDWWSDFWLAAITEQVNPQEIRSYWNTNEAPILFSLTGDAPRIELGRLYADEPQLIDVGPARRIFNLLFLRGTTPEYVLPIVSDSLIAEIMAAGRPTSDDHVGSASTPEDIEMFLIEHMGWNLVPFQGRVG